MANLLALFHGGRNDSTAMKGDGEKRCEGARQRCNGYIDAVLTVCALGRDARRLAGVARQPDFQHFKHGLARVGIFGVHHGRVKVHVALGRRRGDRQHASFVHLKQRQDHLEE